MGKGALPICLRLCWLIHRYGVDTKISIFEYGLPCHSSTPGGIVKRMTGGLGPAWAKYQILNQPQIFTNHCLKKKENGYVLANTVPLNDRPASVCLVTHTACDTYQVLLSVEWLQGNGSSQVPQEGGRKVAPFCPCCCQAMGSKISYLVFHAATDKAER